ncbi:uncharacterized protein M6B38_305910 [Iris pallida]|uniref:Uncharacterized protein n=1 Tax=Iris pallida TaxID=29817 RepID=A0AAX6ERU1_IRIPA|nr:uncharacterized protein M6B38_107185 [Iris pallida]KAJ6841593.1 uncharacterized protein M6B38_305910 [Iris pallida]
MLISQLHPCLPRYQRTPSQEIHRRSPKLRSPPPVANSNTVKAIATTIFIIIATPNRAPKSLTTYPIAGHLPQPPSSSLFSPHTTTITPEAKQNKTQTLTYPSPHPVTSPSHDRRQVGDAVHRQPTTDLPPPAVPASDRPSPYLTLPDTTVQRFGDHPRAPQPPRSPQPRSSNVPPHLLRKPYHTNFLVWCL